MRLSIVVPWCDRDELAVTLGRHRWLDREGVELIVVGHAADRRRLRAIVRDAGVRCVRAVHVPAKRFDKCRALNIGASLATSARLFFLDADVVVARDTLAEALTALRTRTVVTIGRVRESVPQPSVLRRSQVRELAYAIEIVGPRRSARLETTRTHFDDGTRGAPGLVFVHKRHFVRVGGMSSALRRWGWEDLDLLARLQLALGLSRVSVGVALHLSHGDDKRALHGRSRTDSEDDNFRRCLVRYARGDYQGTYAADVARSRPTAA